MALGYTRPGKHTKSYGIDGPLIEDLPMEMVDLGSFHSYFDITRESFSGQARPPEPQSKTERRWARLTI